MIRDLDEVGASGVDGAMGRDGVEVVSRVPAGSVAETLVRTSEIEGRPVGSVPEAEAEAEATSRAWTGSALNVARVVERGRTLSVADATMEEASWDSIAIGSALWGTQTDIQRSVPVACAAFKPNAS